jgi:AcrR family transcriptional regulator
VTDPDTVTAAMSAVKRSAPAKLSRRERAKATQWRIVKAAYTLFCARGYAGTTMAQIAEAAGVAVQTVYFTFHTKSTLLSRAYDFAVMGEAEPLAPDKQPWFGAMTAEPNLAQAVRHVVTGAGEITRRVTPLYLVARVAADGDPDTARVIVFHERWRADGYRAVLELLVTKAKLRPGLSLERATDLLLLFVGPDVYQVLVGGHGWSHEEWVDWTVSTVVEQIFGRAVS